MFVVIVVAVSQEEKFLPSEWQTKMLFDWSMLTGAPHATTLDWIHSSMMPMLSRSPPVLG